MDSFDFDEAEAEGSAVDLVQENPFEPVYPAVSAGLLLTKIPIMSNSHSEKGIVLEPSVLTIFFRLDHAVVVIIKYK